MSIKSDQGLVHEARFSEGGAVDWIEVGDATVRLTMACEIDNRPETPTDSNERIAFTQTVVRNVLNHPNQLTVFYHNETGDDPQTIYHFLTAVVPHPVTPFGFYSRGSYISKGVRISSDRLTVLPAYVGVSVHDQRMSANRQINFSGKRDDSIVWMGARSIADERHPDDYYLQQGQRNQDVAVGSEAVSNLLTRLATDGETSRHKVLGAAVHLGYLALDFGAQVPAVSELSQEIEDQLALAAKQCDFSRQVMTADSGLAEKLSTVSKAFKESREQFKQQQIMHDTAVQSCQPFMGDSRVWRHMDIGDYNHEVSQLTNVESSITEEAAEHLRRLGEYAFFTKVLRSLQG